MSSCQTSYHGHGHLERSHMMKHKLPTTEQLTESECVHCDSDREHQEKHLVLPSIHRLKLREKEYDKKAGD